jgi:GR25 family glycosyltransferase involved in LPS biosynthesis
MFSSGLANTSLAIAELFRELGHEVELIQVIREKKAWWDDCQDLAAHWKVVPVEEAAGYDLLIESDRMMLTPEIRKKVAKMAVWILRHPFLIGELEASLFPTASTPIRRFEGLHEIWMFDSAVEAEEGVVQVVELLSGLPVRIVPHVWSPNVAAAHLRSFGQPKWAEVTAAAEGAGKKREWAVHITETNTTNASSCILPLVILREAKRRGVPISTFYAHNTDQIKQSKFFRENTLRHCTDAAVGLSGECVGRVRCVEWARHPFSCVLSHIRFSTIRTSLLDLAWAGIPVVHNSPRLRDVGCGLETLYYAGNRVGQACEALERLQSIDLSGAAATLDKVRHSLLARYSPISRFVQEGWKRVAGGLDISGAVAVPAAAVQPPQAKQIFRVGFCDMWESFDPTYNFFTLMLAAAGRSLSPPVEVVGGPASPTDDLVIFGPFGAAWTQLPPTQPKVHFTGENTARVDGPGVKLNLGFEHCDMTKEDYLRFPLWLLEIDWFGADADRIANPKPIPLERCTRVYSEEREARHKKFCAFVVSNPSNPVRNAAYQWLDDYKTVDSAGRVYNTVGDGLFAGLGGGGGELKKFEFFKDYKFAITYENSSSRGYTTEKFLHAKAAGCIPIYWGDPVIERDFNLAGAIDARKLRTPEELVAAVRAVDEDDAEWERRFSVPALDSYKVEWCRRTMAECARRMFNLGGLDANSAARFIEITPGAEKPVEPVAAVAVTAVAVAPPPAATAGPLELPIVVTTVTRRFLPSLQHWLMSAAAQKRVVTELEAIVFLGADVEEDSLTALREAFTFVTFERLPDAAPPEGAEEFADYWAPQHYAWKLWVYNELATRPALAGRMILYTDAGSFLCRWPKDWILAAQAADVCMLEDPREENARWCSPAFCEELRVTAEEMAAQQRLGGLMCFRAGSPRAKALFGEAYTWSKKRNVIAGEKWAGTMSDGRPRGHRHDQSILSILSLRQGIATLPLDSIYCDFSLRKTFTSGRSIYVHRGNFTVHKKFAEGIDEAYVINLDRRKDRMERLWSNHPELRGRVERWSAVEGKKLQLTPALGRLLRPNDFLWKKAIAGCALSHLGLWWKLVHEPADIENYLILEDDVKFRAGWEDAWKQAIAREEVPEDYDILYLGGVLPPNRAGFEKTKDRVNASFVRVAENTQWGQQQPTRYFHFCAYAYVLSRRGAQKVMGLLQAHGGYWTSADHILCNPVTILKSYILDPMVAGCYQDDDPAYANASFNDFTRIDSFDSDLWNNDERFTPGEVEEFAKEGEGPLPFAEALADARRTDEIVIGREGHAKAAAALEKEMEPAVAPAAEPLTPRVVTHPIKSLPSRLVCLEDQALDFSKLYECDWLLDLFGRPAMAPVERIHATAPPPMDCPIVIVQRPHTETIGAMLERWDSFGATFKVLHLSDEYGTDPIEFYDLSGCLGVLRTYLRPDIPTGEGGKVLTVPLGFHHTLAEGSKNSLTLTPHIPFRETVWSFFGTGWAERKELLKPLVDLSGVTHRLRFFDQWNDPGQLAEAEYISVLLDSVFVPCPDGNNPETFRFYEALECGAVPLIVRTERNAAWVDWVAARLKLLPLKSWEEAANFVRDVFIVKPQLAERYRETVLREWQSWKEELKRDVEKWLSRK